MERLDEKSSKKAVSKKKNSGNSNPRNTQQWLRSHTNKNFNPDGYFCSLLKLWSSQKICVSCRKLWPLGKIVALWEKIWSLKENCGPSGKSWPQKFVTPLENCDPLRKSWPSGKIVAPREICDPSRNLWPLKKSVTPQENCDPLRTRKTNKARFQIPNSLLWYPHKIIIIIIF